MSDKRKREDEIEGVGEGLKKGVREKPRSSQEVKEYAEATIDGMKKALEAFKIEIQSAANSGSLISKAEKRFDKAKRQINGYSSIDQIDDVKTGFAVDLDALKGNVASASETRDDGAVQGEVQKDSLSELKQLETDFASHSSEVFKTIMNLDTRVSLVDLQTITAENVAEIGHDELVAVNAPFTKGIEGQVTFLLEKDFSAKVVDSMIMGDGEVEFMAEEHLDGIAEAIRELMGRDVEKLAAQTGVSMKCNVDGANLIEPSAIQAGFIGWQAAKFEVKIDFGKVERSFVMWKLTSPELAENLTNAINPSADHGVVENADVPVETVEEKGAVDKTLEKLDEEKLQLLEFTFAEQSGEVLKTVTSMDTSVFFTGMEDFDPENIDEFGDDKLVRVDSAFIEGLPGTVSFLLPKQATAQIVDFMIMGDGHVEFMAEEHLEGIEEVVSQMMDPELARLSKKLNLDLDNEIHAPSLISLEEIKKAYQGWKKVNFDVEVEGQGTFRMWKLLSPDLVAKLTGVSEAPETTTPVEEMSANNEALFKDIESLKKAISENEILTSEEREDFLNSSIFVTQNLSDEQIQTRLDRLGEAFEHLVEGKYENQLFDITSDFLALHEDLHSQVTQLQDRYVRQLRNAQVSAMPGLVDFFEQNLQYLASQSTQDASDQVPEQEAPVASTPTTPEDPMADELVVFKSSLDQMSIDLILAEKDPRKSDAILSRVRENLDQLSIQVAEDNFLQQKLQVLQNFINVKIREFDSVESRDGIAEDQKENKKKQLALEMESALGIFGTTVLVNPLEQVSSVEPATSENPTEVVDDNQSTETSVTSIEDARQAWYNALYTRGKVINRGKKVDFEKAKNDYDRLLNEHLQNKLEEQKASLLAGLDLDNLDPKKIEAILNSLTDTYVGLLKAEEDAMDTLASGVDKSLFEKIKTVWQKHSKLRLVLGLGLFGASFAFSGGATGVIAGILTARGLMSSTGTFLFTESVLDQRTALGQKGLIDKMKNLGFRGKKGGLLEKYAKIGPAEITQEDVNDWRTKLADESAYPTEVLGQELARLRILSLDKSVAVKDAARFGSEQEVFVDLIKEVYFKRLANEFKKTLGDKALAIEGALKIEKNTTELLTSTQDKSRMKAMARYGLSAALGLTVGVVAGSKVLEMFGGADDVAKNSAEAVTTHGDTLETLDQIDKKQLHDMSHTSEDSLAKVSETKVDSVTAETVVKATEAGAVNPSEIAAGHFEDVIHTEVGMRNGDSIWLSTKAIIKAHPGDFGYNGDPNDIGSISKFAEIQTANLVNQLEQTQAGNLADLVHDGDKVIVNFENGKPVLSFEARSGIEAGHLSDFAAPAETVPSSVDGVEVDDVIQTTTNTVNETAPDIVDAATQAATEAVDSSAVEALEQSVSDDKVEGFLTGARAYTGDIYDSIQSYAETAPEHAHEQMSALVDKIFESSTQVQQQFLHDLSPADFTADNNKGTVFLELLKQTDVQLSEINTIDQLKDLLSRFDSFAHSGTLPTSDAFEPRLLNLGSQDGNVYAFVKKASGKFLGLFGEKKYLIDDGNQLVKVGEKVMSTFLQTNKTI